MILTQIQNTVDMATFVTVSLVLLGAIITVGAKALVASTTSNNRFEYNQSKFNKIEIEIDLIKEGKVQDTFHQNEILGKLNTTIAELRTTMEVSRVASTSQNETVGELKKDLKEFRNEIIELRGDINEVKEELKDLRDVRNTVRNERARRSSTRKK